MGLYPFWDFSDSLGLFALILLLCVLIFLPLYFEYAPCEWGNHKGDQFCTKCGTELYSVCPVCETKKSGNYCSECGYDFSILDPTIE